MPDSIGLNLGDDDTLSDNTDNTCPDCGSLMAHEFRVEAESEEIATRVFVAYYATKNIPLETLKAVLDQKLHLHVLSDDDCAAQ